MWCLTGTAIIPWTVRLVIQIDFVGKVCVIQFDFSFLGQTIFSYCLECLLNINGLFSTSLKVWYIVFALTPTLSSLSWDLNQTIGHQIFRTNRNGMIIEKLHQYLRLYFLNPLYFRWPQTENFRDLWERPESEIHLSRNRVIWRYWERSRQTLIHNNLLRDRTQRPMIETFPVLRCPISLIQI